MPGINLEATVRLGCFFSVLAAMLVWEHLAPRRGRAARTGVRRASNLALVALNTLAVRLLIPVAAVAAAGMAQSHGWGVLNLLDWPLAIEVPLAVLVLDFAIYAQHVAFHYVPLFWRLHRVHHVDLDVDVTTGVRFHTLEILLSGLLKTGLVIVLGAAPVAVVVFEVVLNATSMFNHSNVYLPLKADAFLRILLVTPDMHRIHHSTLREETNSNFGFNLPWWDFLFRTYRHEPADGQLGMTIGLAEYRDERQTSRLPGMLWLPFARRSS